MTNGFKVIGISVRTTNKNNQSARDLTKLWGQFYSDNVMAKIPNKKSNNILSIYTDYRSDYTDEYNATIGVEVTTLDEIPKGMTGREFEPEHFLKITARGEMPGAVVKVWTDIWKRENELRRKYTYDFEVYSEKSQLGENSEVEIFIAVQ